MLAGNPSGDKYSGPAKSTSRRPTRQCGIERTTAEQRPNGHAEYRQQCSLNHRKYSVRYHKERPHLLTCPCKSMIMLGSPSHKGADCGRSIPELYGSRGGICRPDRQRVAGQITEQTYKEALNALRVKDNEGYTWMLQERTGNWYVYRDGTWSPGTPPVQESAGPPGPPPPPTAAEPISNASEVPHPYASPPQGFPPRVGVAPASESPVSAYPAGAPQAAFPPPVPPATNPVPAAPYANTAAYAQAAAYTPLWTRALSRRTREAPKRAAKRHGVSGERNAAPAA